MRMFRTLSVAAVAFSSVLVTACGKPVVVKDVHLQSFEKDQESWGSVAFDISTGDIQLPSLTIPVINPENPSVTFGDLTINAGLNSVTEIKVEVNLTQVAQVQAGKATLPNGTDLPVGGLDAVGVVQLPLGHTSSKLYIAMNDSTAVAGVALGIKELGGVSKYVGSARLFFPFQIASGLAGTAGIYTGTDAGSTGLGLFVDASGVWKDVHPAQSAFSLRGLTSVFKTKKAPLSFRTIRPSSSKESRINNAVYDLHNRRTRVSIE